MSMQLQDPSEKPGPAPKGAERRQYDRYPTPQLHIRFGGKNYRTQNWSMGGFLLDGYDGQLSTGSLVSVTGIGYTAKAMTDVNVRARVVRADAESGHLAVTYLGLDDAAYTFLQEAIVNRGKA